jgi:hypothetical protein
VADWLEANGDDFDRARALLLRIQCEADRTLDPGPEYDRIRARKWELQDRYAAFWLGPLFQPAIKHLFPWGLVSLEMDVRTLLGPRAAAWATMEAWAWVEWLRLEHVFAVHVRKLAECPHLGSIGDLFLRCQEIIDERSAALLADSPLLENLITLRLCHLGPAGILTLLQSPHLKRLTRLELLGNGLQTRDALALLDSTPHLDRLTELFFAGNHFGDEVLQALARDRRVSQLTSLRFAHTPGITDTGIVALAGSPHLSNLTTLHLDDARITSVGAQALIDSPYLRNVTYLRVLKEAHRIDQATQGALRERFGASLY